MVHLVDKLNSSKWIALSGSPNSVIVKKWINKNNLDINLISVDSGNRETLDLFKQKIIYSDLFADPRHIRWLEDLKKVINGFDGKCIIWSGTAGDAFFKYGKFHKYGVERYWWLHKTRVPSWQGIGHQVRYNVLGVPSLSVYHSPEMLEVLRSHDPSELVDGQDLRPEIAYHLTDRADIWWPSSNPDPLPYDYHSSIDANALYYEALNKACLT